VLRLLSGTLTNSSGATIRRSGGNDGTRTLDAPLGNQGTLTVNRALASPRPARCTPTPARSTSNAKLTIQQSGASPSFTNSGSILINTGDTLAVTGGHLPTAAASVSGGTWTLGPSTSRLAGLQHGHVRTDPDELHVGWRRHSDHRAQHGALRRGATINSALVNQGALTVSGTTAFNGAVTNAPGATLRLQGNGAFGTGNLTVANGFTNSGSIVLTDSTSSYGAALNVTTGTLNQRRGRDDHRGGRHGRHGGA